MIFSTVAINAVKRVSKDVWGEMARYKLVCWQIIQQGGQGAKTVNRSWVGWKKRRWQNNARWKTNLGVLLFPSDQPWFMCNDMLSFVSFKHVKKALFVISVVLFVYNNGYWIFITAEVFCAEHVVVKYWPVISNVLCALLINIGRQNCISLQFLQSQLISISSRPRHYSWKWLVIATLAVQSTMLQSSTASMGS